MLNGNVGVMKSMMAELTDETNMARASSLISITWAIGNTIGYIASSLYYLADIYGRLGPSLVVYYRGPRIIGQICSRILFGENTHISCHVSRPRRMHLYRFLLLRFS